MPGMIELQSTLVVQRPQNCEWLMGGEGKTFELDLAPVYRAEARREELVMARGHALVELANAFDLGYDHICKLHSRVIYELELATIASRKRRAVILRDEMPQILQQRGWTTAKSPVGSADIRDTVFYEDSEFVALEQYRATLEAIKELLFGKTFSLARMCKRAEVLIQRRDPSVGNGDHDSDGDRLETKMVEVMDNVETRPSVKRGFATRERD